LRIPAYQIYNVLQQYADQLSGSGSGNESSSGQANPVDDAGFFASRKRRKIIKTITETIKENVSRVKVADRQERENETPSSVTAQEGPVVKNGESTPFVYNVIDKDHRKVKRTIGYQVLRTLMARDSRNFLISEMV